MSDQDKEDIDSKHDNWEKKSKDLGVSEIIPKVYEDGLSPAVKELGKGLKTVAQSINIALAPVKGVVWSYEKIESFLKEKLEEKLKDVNPEDIVPPPINIAGPTIEALRFATASEELSEMFANLLGTSMDNKEKDKAHPAYIELIKQLSSEEARFLKKFYTNEVQNKVYNLIQLSTTDTETTYFIINRFIGDTARLISIIQHTHEESPLELASNKINSILENNESPLSESSFLNLVRLGIFHVVTVNNDNDADELLPGESPRTNELPSFMSKYQFKYKGNTSKKLETKLFLTNFGNTFLNICINE